MARGSSWRLTTEVGHRLPVDIAFCGLRARSDVGAYEVLSLRSRLGVAVQRPLAEVIDHLPAVSGVVAQPYPSAVPAAPGAVDLVQHEDLFVVRDLGGGVAGEGDDLRLVHAHRGHHRPDCRRRRRRNSVQPPDSVGTPHAYAIPLSASCDGGHG
jgi:hypothetical protein